MSSDNTLPDGPSDALPDDPTDALPDGPTDALPSGPTDALPSGPTDALPSGPTDAIITSAANKIAIAFDMDEDRLAPSLNLAPSLASIRDALADRIVQLLNNNPERLMMLLYRIDVSEDRVNDIFNNALPPDVPEMLADLIIERQIAKAETRARGGV